MSLTKSVALVGNEPKMELNELGLASNTSTIIYTTCVSDIASSNPQSSSAKSLHKVRLSSCKDEMR